jgi:hypothetical protein
MAAPEREVPRDRVDRLDRIVELQQVEPLVPRLDRGEDERRRADLEQRRNVHAVRVADDDVQAPPTGGVGVRLVPRVDDRPPQGGLEADLGLHVVRALGDLEARLLAALPEPHPARSGEDLAGDEVGGDASRKRVEGHGAVNEEVLVRSVRGALSVNVVLVEGDQDPVDGGGDRGPARHLVPRPVPQHRVPRGGHLGAGVLRVGVVNIEAGAVGEHGIEVGGILPRAAPAAEGDTFGRARGRVRQEVGVSQSPGPAIPPLIVERILSPVVPGRGGRADGLAVLGHEPAAEEYGVGAGVGAIRDSVLRLDAADSHASPDRGRATRRPAPRRSPRRTPRPRGRC